MGIFFIIYPLCIHRVKLSHSYLKQQIPLKDTTDVHTGAIRDLASITKYVNWYLLHKCVVDSISTRPLFSVCLRLLLVNTKIPVISKSVSSKLHRLSLVSLDIY